MSELTQPPFDTRDTSPAEMTVEQRVRDVLVSLLVRAMKILQAAVIEARDSAESSSEYVQWETKLNLDEETDQICEIIDSERSTNWQVLHEMMPCGHPRACWQDRNWPESDRNYNPETKTSNPPSDYRCTICEQDASLRAELDRLRAEVKEWQRIARETGQALAAASAEVKWLKADLNRAKCVLAGLALTADEKTAKAWAQLAAATRHNATLHAGLEKAIHLMENGWCEPDLVRLKQVLITPAPPPPDWRKLWLPDQPPRDHWYCPKCGQYHELVLCPIEVKDEQI